MLSLILTVALAVPAGVDTPSDEDAPVHPLGSDQWHWPQAIESIERAGALVAVGSGPAVLIFDPARARRHVRHQASCAPIQAISWSDDMVVAGCNNPILTNRSLFAWRPGETEPMFVAATPAPVTAVARVEVAGEDVVVAGLSTGSVHFVRIRDAQVLTHLEVGGPVRRLSVQGVDSEVLEITTDSDAYRLERSTLTHLGAPRPTATARRLQAAGIELAPNQPHAITTDGLLVTAGKYGRVMKVFDLDEGRAIHQGHGAAINGQAVAPDGQRVATVDLEGEVKVWHISTGETLAVWHIPPPADVSGVATEGALVAWIGEDMLLVGSGSGGMFTLRPGAEPTPVAERDLVVDGVVSADGRQALVIERGGRASMRSRGPKGRVLWHTGALGRREDVVRVFISADGRRAVTVAYGRGRRHVRLHDGRTGKELWRGEGIDAALSADGRVLAVAHGGTVTSHEVPSMRVLAESHQTERPSALALDPTGRWLAVASAAGVQLFRVGQAEPAVVYREGLGAAAEWLRFAAGFLVAHAPDAPSLRALTLPGDELADGWRHLP